ncbi:MAG TPA: VanW family protein [Gammaproteobacteria bacterium]|nr:VanW family protein [Gammaproteobacteria bacterium]
MLNIILTIILAATIAGKTALISPVAPVKTLAAHEFSLEKRYGNTYVNDVFKDNILLTLDYLAGQKIEPTKVDWKNVEKPDTYKVTLKPGQTFAFHDDLLPKYDGKVAVTTNAEFNSTQGFKSDGYLVGDGVCHLASLLYWTAKDAGLDAYAPVRHDFAPVPEVPREFGVSIYATPGASYASQQQNLYITNNKSKDVSFVFAYDGQNLKISAEESI